MKWSISEQWNECAQSSNRDPEKREHLWASELGSPDIDVLLKTKGTPYTNPPNERSLRKFMAGNIWEGVMEMIFRSCDLIIDREKRAELVIGGQKVTGRSDFIAGGHPDFLQSVAYISTLPESFQTLANDILERIKKYKGKNLQPTVIELKSASSYAFELLLHRDEPFKNHKFQCRTYMEAEGMDGKVFYICKDDCRVKEFNLYLHEKELTKEWKDEIKHKQNVIQTGKAEKENLILFDKMFSKNLGVEYSNYLKRVYGFNTPEDYREAVDKKISRWNRVLTRMNEDKEMTANNLEAIEEMKAEGVYDGTITNTKNKK